MAYLISYISDYYIAPPYFISVICVILFFGFKTGQLHKSVYAHHLPN